MTKIINYILAIGLTLLSASCLGVMIQDHTLTNFQVLFLVCTMCVSGAGSVAVLSLTNK
jgi:hypothetical protein